MALAKYRNLQFFTDTCHNDFYTYANVKELSVACTTSKEEVIKCRTVGILQSQHGQFWLVDMEQSDIKLRVSVAYLKSAPPCPAHAYPVQVFGTVHYRNRPVIFLTMLRVLSIPAAIRLRDVMSNIVAVHLATREKTPPEDE